MKKNALRYVVSAAISLVAVYAVVMSSGCSSGSDSTPTPTPTPTTYTGKIYMASEKGGHIAIVPVTIDPSNTTAPISVGSITKVQLTVNASDTGSNNKTHIFHDVRLDGDKLFYSAIYADSSTNPEAGKVHLGYLDLTNASPSHADVHDAVIDTPAGSGMVYCGSGQTTSHYLPMTMSYPAYIDAIAKSEVTSGASLTAGTSSVKRTSIAAFRGDADYIFAHGVNSPDHSKLFVAVNDTDVDAGGTVSGMKGTVTTYLLDASAVVGGTVDPSSVTTSHTIPGLSTAGATIAFRSTYTPDGSKILQAGKDRLLVLNGSNLDVIANDINIGGSYRANGVENHDVIPTPDGKYAILAMRYKVHSGDAYNDSGLQLYDLTTNKQVGNIVSTCNTCHDSTSASRNTCGIEAKWQP